MALYHHIPVLLKETLDLLECRRGDTVLDATIGGAGHSAEIAKRIMPDGLLIGIDRDEEAVEAARLRLRDYGERVSVVHGDFRNLATIVSELGVHTVDKVLFDFGASSVQFDDPERGFSYWADEAPLDMRMDRSQALTAADLVNDAPLEELTSIIRRFGEEPFAGRIAELIVARRKSAPISSVGDLVEIVKAAIPARFRRTGGHPARRTFQALRIAVNRELEAVEAGLESAFDLLAEKGVLAAITFHSLEDRIVKTKFREWARSCICPREAPVCTCGGKARAELLSRGGIVPSEQEIAANPRARSARLRAVRKVLHTPGGEY
ncbi:MAG: 16S rRNA (cytosine(1402)-N(4))-methyltransferase RsmH [Firmicutes bacterium]|nr:16S rRNA (cytosine(1402)-N(4))-methyltransferase RsmH [Bacillota bacterium]